MTRRPLVNVMIPVDVRDITDDQLFERLHTVAFSFGEMNRAIGFDRIHAKLDLEAWHDQSVPGCYRARVAEIARMTFERFRGLKYTEELRHAFIRALRADVYKYLEPIEPEIKFHRTHDEWPS
jgi:hypothetical protein